MTILSSVQNIDEQSPLILLLDQQSPNLKLDFLSKSDKKTLKVLAKKGINSTILHQENRCIFVQFITAQTPEHLHQEKARQIGSALLETIRHYKCTEITITDQTKTPIALAVAEGMALTNYQFLKYYTDKAKRKTCLETIHLLNNEASKAALKELSNIIEGTCLARTLINEPLSYLTAVQLSKEIQAMGKASGCTVKVFDKKKIESLKMGGILAVNLGSFTPPTFSIVEWKPKNAINKKPIVLVGKGVVYDTGGLSLKPTKNSMDFMKADMGGAAVVTGTMLSVAKNKLPLHVIALIPSTDNRPGNNAYVPGDVIKMYDGTTVEVLNTDAEGRMLLADALAFAKKYDPLLTIDFATLTGSAARAVSPHAIAYMGTAAEVTKKDMVKASFETYERLVEFPLWEDYGDMLKSDIADLKNIGGASAGMITAGKFLEHFTDYPWLHFDVAGSEFLHQPMHYRGKNGTGVGVRLMYAFLKNYCK